MMADDALAIQQQQQQQQELASTRRTAGYRAWLDWFLRNPRVYISGGFIVLICVAAVAAPLLTGDDPNRMNAGSQFLNPGEGSLLGTDALGRDLFARMLFGARLTLLVSIGSVAVAFVAGTAIGMCSGYFGNPVDTILMRMVDAVMAFPGILLAIFVVTFWGPSLTNIIIVIGVLYIPRFARVAYSTTLLTRTRDYVTAARAIGSQPWRILGNCILPNIMAPQIVQISLSLGTAILLESSLSFLGLGPSLTLPSWGRAIQEASRYLSQHPWGVVWPSIAISVTVLAFNILGDALRDRLDPRLRT